MSGAPAARRQGKGAVPWHSSLRFRLVAAAFAIELLMLGMLVANSYRLVTDALESQTRTRLEALTPLLNTSLAGYLFQRDHSEINGILKELVTSRTTDIRYIVVLDNQQRMVASIGSVDAAKVATLPIDTSVQEALRDLVYDTKIKLALHGNTVGSVHFGLSLIGMAALRDNMLRQSLMIAGIELLLSLLLLSSGGWLITRHITRLLGATRAIAQGDYGQRIAIPGKDEIGLLATDFNVMADAVQVRIANLHAAQEELRASEARFRNVFEDVSDAIFVVEMPGGRIVNVNRRVCEMFGYTREQAQTLDVGAFAAGASPYAAEDARRWLDRAQAEGPQTFEWHARKLGGELFWVEVSLRLSEKSDGRQMMAVVRDISERKQAEQELAQRNADLERFNRVSVNRELDMIALKKRVNALSVELGRAQPFDLAAVNAAEAGAKR